MTVEKSDRWIVVRSRVGLAGRVTVAGGDTASGGVLGLTAARGADRQTVAASSPDVPRHYDTRIRGDGFYFFLDLPGGDYVINGQDERGNEIEAQPVSILPADASGHPHVVILDLIASAKQARIDDGRQRRRGPRRPGAGGVSKTG